MARGGDGYPFAATAPVIPFKDTPLLANEVTIYLRELDRVRSRIEGRLVAK
jgi:hypothetical protein